MTKETLLEGGTVKVIYLYSEATGPTITGLYMNNWRKSKPKSK